MKNNDEKYNYLQEIESLNKAIDNLAGHQNLDQRIKHLNKLKQENNHLKQDKLKVRQKLVKTIKQRDKLQKVIKLLLNNFSSCKKKVDELAKRLNTKEKSVESDIKMKYKLKN